MAPVIHFIRHGQGLHNVSGNYELSDPLLTTLGKQQCESLFQASFPDQKDISLVVASPLTRALETANVIFSPALTSGGKCAPKIIAHPCAQETSDDACDIGSSSTFIAKVAADNHWPVDLSLVEDGWNNKAIGSSYGPDSKSIKARALQLRLFLRQQIRNLVQRGDTDAQIVLIAHGSFLHFLTNDWEDSYRNPGTGWKNCETRSYVFESDFMRDTDADAWLNETMESRSHRGLHYPMYTKDQQINLYKVAMDQWGLQGLQRPDKL